MADMPRETLTRLLERRRHLAGRLSELDSMRRPFEAELEQIEREIFQRLKVMAAAMEGEEGSGESKRPPFIWPSRSTGESLAVAIGLSDDQDTGKETVRLLDHAVEALRAAGPMSRNQLFDYLVGKGVAIPGKDPRANLSAHLSNSDKIKRDDQGLWTLRSAVNETLEDKKQAPA